MSSVFKKLSVSKHSVDIGLLFAVTICATISTLLIYSIARSGISEIEGVGNSYWITQLVSMGMGVFAAFIISFIDYRKLVKFWPLFAIVSIGFVALTFTSLGYQREGADDQGWIKIFGISMQPSEIMKIAFILTFSYHLSKDEEDMNKPLHMLLLLLHGGIPIGIVGLQGDYGTAIVFAAIFGFMLISAKISWKYLAIAPFAIAGVVAVMWFNFLSQFHKERILILFHPGTDPENIEYQQDLGLAAIKSGGVFGKGLFANSDEYIYVPELHNDFIFAHVGQVFGFIGSLGVLIVLAYICLKVFADSRITRDRLGRFICMGAFGLFFTHCLMNIGMVLKVAPVIGVPLPFLSGGGTAMLSMYVVIGLVLSTYSHRAVTYNVFYDDNDE
ncbi:FtsW/RodA/SpoVE family cell cycle protein [Ruminococcus sp. XPD3002]|uniref:FtsW/RodA/SpoVE family cell cycle protein n=1 Tax=Ruminococcus sp. XPD3002 TaxID=1452269 RepID=UPI00092322EE|nr:FtsW/RodA/SpoVE family cell cycle protein [Ruminococcus sp.]SFX34455.1 rod shape determining protein RodA [Ruminococcus flavefaciens]HPY84798.1 FtsW/RodA/SpoVE family cell cycle protein [Ruminococcus flavefaciens]HRU99536.1 FtsW/RodA/SpoVE family cell cycle protein [Ruminococcus sp.]